MGRGPHQVGEFIGQKKVISALTRVQAGAKARGERMPHVIFVGPSGTGKSKAATTLGHMAGTNVVKFVGNVSAVELAVSLTSAKPYEIYFLDESHRLDGDVQEVMFEVIDANQVPGKLVPGADPTKPTEVAPVTFLLATDRPGKLLNALVKRIPLQFRFNPYPIAELKEIVARIAERRGVLLSPQATRELARVCHGLPRRAEHHVDTLRLSYADSERRQLGVDDVRAYLEEVVGLDECGFDEFAREYMRFLKRNKVASAEAIAGYLGVDVDHVKSQVEQPLRFAGLVTVGRGGRTLTDAGKEWAKSHFKKRPKGEKNG